MTPLTGFAILQSLQHALYTFDMAQFLFPILSLTTLAAAFEASKSFQCEFGMIQLHFCRAPEILKIRHLAICICVDHGRTERRGGLKIGGKNNIGLFLNPMPNFRDLKTLSVAERRGAR
jgi:hypothetical protein